MINTEVWFNLPGMAFNLISKAGIAKEWITSLPVKINLTWVSTGNTTLLSTSNNLNCPSSKLAFYSLYIIDSWKWGVTIALNLSMEFNFI